MPRCVGERPFTGPIAPVLGRSTAQARTRPPRCRCSRGHERHVPKPKDRWPLRREHRQNNQQPARAVEFWTHATELQPKVASFWEGLADARGLAGDADGANDAARKAVEFTPGSTLSWRALGVARYRAGDWKGASSALEQARRISTGDNSYVLLFLAMTHWQLGDKNQARQWYDKAVQWMDKNKPKDEELRRFRAEASALLGIKDSPK